MKRYDQWDQNSPITDQDDGRYVLYDEAQADFDTMVSLSATKLEQLWAELAILRKALKEEKGYRSCAEEKDAEIDSHKKVIKSQGKAIDAYCKKIGELNEDTERTIAEKVEMQSEINQLLNERRADKAEIDEAVWLFTHKPPEGVLSQEYLDWHNRYDSFIAKHRGE